MRYSGHLYLSKTKIKSKLPAKAKDGRLYFKLVPAPTKDQSSQRRRRTTTTTTSSPSRRSTLDSSLGGSNRGGASSLSSSQRRTQDTGANIDEHSGESNFEFSWMCESRDEFDRNIARVQKTLNNSCTSTNHKRESLIITGFVRQNRGISAASGLGLAGSPKARGRSPLGKMRFSLSPRNSSKSTLLRKGPTSPHMRSSKALQSGSPSIGQKIEKGVKLRRTEHPKLPFSAENKMLSKYVLSHSSVS